MKRAVILTARMNQYRIDFYNGLRRQLAENNVELVIIYGEDSASGKKDETELEWGISIPTKVIKLGKGELYWQPALKYLKRGDMVIVQQANKLIINYLFIAFRRLFSVKMAYWGHGLNLQIDRHSLANKFKKRLIKHTDWWFAYTEGIKNIIVNNGFPAERTTVVENAIDTRKLQRFYENLTEEDAERVRTELGLKSDNVGIFCGGIYEEKRVDFLVEAVTLIREKVKDFEFIIIGAGPDVPKLKNFIQDKPWIHYVGPKFHEERVPYFKVSKVFLMPGLVGLAILDSFALQTPMFTTDYPFHSPEIEYLRNGYNGVMTENKLQAYADQVAEVLLNENSLNKLIEGCKASVSHHTVEKMVENFKNGILGCLNVQKIPSKSHSQ